MIQHFKPDHYFTTIGSHEPVLTIDSGDTLVTTCVDAWGQDERGKRVTPPGNPMSGPFFVKGAKPGDALYVTGRLGGSHAGKHLDFTPRLAEARWLVTHSSRTP